MDGLASDGSLDVVDLSLSGFLLGGGVVELRLRNDARLDQLLRAAILNARQIALGFQVGELRLFLANIEIDQNVSLMYRLAGFEVNLVDSPRQIGAHRDPLDCGRRPDDR